eukprot:GHVU01222577.1.p1 GENE.GHVU01222577.1~~GHVU01222577.1.p1  ORF type:complete len:148 (-),score=9.78 GHVU01222577.1:112-555(-)
MYFAGTELMVTNKAKHLSETIMVKLSSLPNNNNKAEWYKFLIERMKLAPNENLTKKAWKINAADDLENGHCVVFMRASDGTWLRLRKDNTTLLATIPPKLEFLVLFKTGEWSLRGESVWISRSEPARDGQVTSLCHPAVRLCAPRFQ